MSTRSRSRPALKAALDIIGPCHPDTAAYLILKAAVEHLCDLSGSEKASELVYGLADHIATGRP